MREAHCCCGSLRVRCEGGPAKVSLCHCKACQRRTGSSFGLVAFFPRHAVEVRGIDRQYARTAESGRMVTFHFCPTCGSTLYWEREHQPDVIGVAVGAFADASFPAPTQQVYGAERQAWLPDLLEL